MWHLQVALGHILCSLDPLPHYRGCLWAQVGAVSSLFFCLFVFHYKQDVQWYLIGGSRWVCLESQAALHAGSLIEDFLVKFTILLKDDMMVEGLKELIKVLFL